MTASSPAGSRLQMRDRIVGLECTVPLLDGRQVPYVNLDNAASTPPLRDVLDALERFLPYYASVHRGTGFKSRLSTAAYDRRRGRRSFRRRGPDNNTVIFGKNDRSHQQAGPSLSLGAG